MNETATDMNVTTEAAPRIAPRQSRQVIRFNSIQEVCDVARTLYMSGVTPANVDRWEKLIPMLLTGAELGLGIMQSIKAITPPVNGVCSLYGDTGLAMIRASGQLVKMDERIEGEGDDRVAVCEIQRQGYSAKRFEYPLTQAKKLASYKGQTKKGVGPWHDDPENMLKWRARWKAWRTEFTDVLNGMGGAEEEETITVEVVNSTVNTPALTAGTSVPTPAANPTGPTNEQLTEMSRLRKLLLNGQANPTEDDIRAAWLAELATFNVTSAKQLTQEQAVAFLKQVGEKADPFTYPAASTAQPEPTAAT